MENHLTTASRFSILEYHIQFYCTWSLNLDVKCNNWSQYKAFTCHLTVMWKPCLRQSEEWSFVTFLFAVYPNKIRGLKNVKHFGNTCKSDSVHGPTRNRWKADFHWPAHHYCNFHPHFATTGKGESFYSLIVWNMMSNHRSPLLTHHIIRSSL